MLYLLIILIVLFVAYLVVAYLTAYGTVYLDRQPVPKTPADYGMQYESVELKPSDGITLRGWLIPGTQKKLVIMTHVGGLTKYGSTTTYHSLFKLYNKEVEFLKTARHLHDAGYNVLMFDFRNHGESDPSPNHGVSGVGLEEYKDIIAALDFIASRPDLKDNAVGFASFCMGANATITAMGKEPERFKDIKCMVAIQPLSLPGSISMYVRRFLTPIGAALFLPPVKLFTKLLSGYGFYDRSPAPYIPDIHVPTLYVQAAHDTWAIPGEIQSFYDRTQAPKDIFWIEDTKHRFETYSYFQDRPERLLNWLAKWM